jgi:hypothetical protein
MQTRRLNFGVLPHFDPTRINVKKKNKDSLVSSSSSGAGVETKAEQYIHRNLKIKLALP